MTKLPKKVRVLTRWYTIKTDNVMKTYGLCDRHKRVISINVQKCECREIILQTLWHEIGHAWTWEAGMVNNTNGDCDEMIVESFAALVIDLTGGKIRQRR